MIRLGAPIWIGLRFDALALEIIERHDNRPVAVIEHQRVYTASTDILEAGMAVATAHALVSDLIAVARQPEREVQRLEALAHWAYRITPTVTLGADCTLLLEIGSCLRLYGDLATLLLRIRSALAQRGHTVSIGVAHTPKAAWLLAPLDLPPPLHTDSRIDGDALQRQLAPIPVPMLPVEPKVRTGLRHMGIETLGRLLAFEPALLGKRFGAPFIRYLQQLTGHLPDPQATLELAPEFDRHLAFLDGCTNRQSLLFPMKRLLQEFTDYLVARQLVCRSLQWRFSDAHTVCATMTIELSRPHHRWKAMLDVSQLKLDQVELPELVFSVTLFADQFHPAGAASFALFEEDSANEEGHALLDRLASRLGADALQRISTTDSLWPEAASHCVALAAEPEQNHAAAGERPTWLLPAPEPLFERRGVLCWKQPLEILRGPERLESPPHCGPVRRRDYFVAREKSGRFCWIFRELETGLWFVHGLFG